MKCEHIQELLSPYIDSITNEKENQAVEAHLETCARCREELEQLRRVCTIMHDLKTPQLPESFSEDLRRRLIDEQNSILKHRQVRRPRKQGWIAAGVAGIALTLGIYASSFFPAGTIVALWDDKAKNNDEVKPRVAVEDIIQNIADEDERDANSITGPVNIAENSDPGTGDTTVKPSATQTGNKPAPSAEGTAKPETPVVVVAPRVADIYSTSVNVENTNDSLAEVIQLAESSGLEYSYIDNGSRVQAFSGSNTKGIALKIPSENVDNVLAQLQAIGNRGAVSHSTIELTKQYTEAEQRISSLKQQQNAIQSKDTLSEEEQAQLGEISQQLQTWNNKKTRLEKQLKMVTLEIYLVQDLVP